MTVDEKTAVEAWNEATVPKETKETKETVSKFKPKTSMPQKPRLIVYLGVLVFMQHFSPREVWLLMSIFGFCHYSFCNWQYKREKAQQREVDNVP